MIRIKVHNIFLSLKQYCRILLLGFVLLMTFVSSAQCLSFGPSYDHAEYLQYCSAAKFEEKYNDENNACWSCAIINVMFDGMKKTITILYNNVQPLCLMILPLGLAIWLAVYLLKALGSFATQDAGKVLDGIMVTMFKIALVYAIIASGLNEIVSGIVSPLLSIGMDIGKGYSQMAREAFS